MKKSRVLFFVLFVFVLFTNVLTYASNELPDFELPNIESQNPPSLSQSYEKMLKELQSEGLDHYKFGIDKKDLIEPEVEEPAGTGKKAVEKFEERFGDMKGDPSRELDKKSTIPDDSFFNKVRDFETKNKKDVSDISRTKEDAMSKRMKIELDKNELWDMDKELKKANDNLKSTSGFLSGTPKPDAWDSVKKQSNVEKKPSAPKSTAHKVESNPIKRVWDTIKDVGGKAIDYVKDLGGKIVDRVKNFFGSNKKVDDATKEMKQNIKESGRPSDSDLKNYKEKLKEETKSKLPFFKK